MEILQHTGTFFTNTNRAETMNDIQSSALLSQIFNYLFFLRLAISIQTASTRILPFTMYCQ